MIAHLMPRSGRGPEARLPAGYSLRRSGSTDEQIVANLQEAEGSGPLEKA
jgi:hypothetical protein